MGLCCKTTILKYFKPMGKNSSFKFNDFCRNKNEHYKNKSLKSKNLFSWNFFSIFSSLQNTFLKKNNSALPKNFFSGIDSFYFEKGNPIGHMDNFSPLILNKINDEKNFREACNYLKFQKDINVKMRAILVDWLVDVHIKFKLSPKTLFLTISILDRFLGGKKLIRQKLQLLGITSMLIASKYEEIYAPETKDFVYISDNAYTKEDIFRMETLVCNVLNFEFSYPSLFFFLIFFLKKADSKKITVYLSNYLGELSITEILMCRFGPSRIAFSITTLIKKIYFERIYEKNISDLFFQKFSFFKNKKLEKECTSLLKSLLLLGQNGKQKNDAIRKKYNIKKFGQISLSRFSVYFCEYFG